MKTRASFLILSILALGGLASCSKDDSTPSDLPPPASCRLLTEEDSAAGFVTTQYEYDGQKRITKVSSYYFSAVQYSKQVTYSGNTATLKGYLDDGSLDTTAEATYVFEGGRIARVYEENHLNLAIDSIVALHDTLVYGYDADKRLTQIHHTGIGMNTKTGRSERRLGTDTYQYNADGLLTQIVQTEQIGARAQVQKSKTVYAYDAVAASIQGFPSELPGFESIHLTKVPQTATITSLINGKTYTTTIHYHAVVNAKGFVDKVSQSILNQGPGVPPVADYYSTAYTYQCD